MTMLDELEAFTAPDVFNPWRDADPLDAPECGPGHRRVRLAVHFSCEPLFLLIGEAPGYQGAHFSGVAFTNESLLMRGMVPRIQCPTRITTRPRPWSEPSATIVWGTLQDLGIAESTVMWNSFAWHPHKPGEPMSNRAPTEKELADGLHILQAVVKRFDGCYVVAVGKVAEKSLKRLGIKTQGAVRHPSMGGANAFRSGMRELFIQRHSPKVAA